MNDPTQVPDRKVKAILDLSQATAPLGEKFVSDDRLVASRELLGYLSDGTPVFDRKGHSHLKDHGAVVQFLPECFARISVGDFSSGHMARDFDLGRIIGNTSCLETGSNDIIKFATRPGRECPSRFVLQREPQPSTMATLILTRSEYDGRVVMLTAYIGSRAPQEPWSRLFASDSRQYQQAVKFWSSHALVPEPVMGNLQFTDCAPVYWKRYGAK